MKIIIGSDMKAREILSPYDEKWYKRGQEYDVDFSIALRLSRDPEFGARFPYQRFEYNPDRWNLNREAAIIQEMDPVSGWGNVATNLIKYSPDIKFSQVGKK